LSSYLQKLHFTSIKLDFQAGFFAVSKVGRSGRARERR
jgi:hypothetical protein